MEFLFIAEYSKKSVFVLFVNPVALGLAKTQLSFSLFECSRVNEGVCGCTTLFFFTTFWKADKFCTACLLSWITKPFQESTLT